jgi:predicted deacylase
MIRSVAYAAEEAGPRFLVLGAVHGNEKCGTIAINRAMQELDSGALKLIRGRVTFVPICNPRAYAEDKRYIERNLNRYLLPMDKPDSYEARLGNALCPLLADCDVLLDIHSYTVGGAPFVFVGKDDQKGQEFAANLGDYSLLTGWAEAYAKTGRKKVEADKNESVGTTEYARLHGATAVTIECGQHKALDAPEVAYQAIRHALRYLELTQGPKREKRPVSAASFVTVEEVYYRKPGEELARDWKHLQPLAKGEIIARGTNGETIISPGDGYIVMPHATSPIGEEWFYFGVKVAA